MEAGDDPVKMESEMKSKKIIGLAVLIACVAALVVLMYPAPETKSGELSGVWSQFIKGKFAGKYAVVYTGTSDSPYRMAVADISGISPGMTPSKGIYNVTYDGVTWRFHSDWGFDTGIFELRKIDSNTFEGLSYGKTTRHREASKWIREP